MILVQRQSDRHIRSASFDTAPSYSSLLQINVPDWQSIGLWHIYLHIAFEVCAQQKSGMPVTLHSADQAASAVHWSHFPHDADVGVRGVGPDAASAFGQAALAMTAVITEPQRVLPQTPIEIACEAPDLELLLYDWLNALVYEMATRHMLFGQFSVVIDDTQLRARLGRKDRYRATPAARRGQGRNLYRAQREAGQQGFVVRPVRTRCLTPEATDHEYQPVQAPVGK